MSEPNTIADIIASLHAIARAGTHDHGNGCGTVTGESMLAGHVANALAIIDARIGALEPFPGYGPGEVMASAREEALDDVLGRGRTVLADAIAAELDATSVEHASGSTDAIICAQLAESVRDASTKLTAAVTNALPVLVPMARVVAAAVAAETDACMACVVAASTEGEGIGGALQRIRERLPRRFGDER